MAWHLPIAEGGGGLIWFVIVLFVIISKIVKAGKENQGRGATPSAPRTEFLLRRASPCRLLSAECATLCH